MAQDISGTSLLSNSQAATATPCFRARFDWDEAGFGSLGSWTNETTRVQRMSGEMRAVGWKRSIGALGGGVANSCTVVLDNEECTSPYSGFRFSPTNANGPLYSKIGGGKLRMMRAYIEMGYEQAGSPQYVPVMAGYIVEPEENYRARTVQFSIRDRAAAAILSRDSTVLYENVSARSYIETLAALLDRDPPGPGERDIDLGTVLHPFAWLDDEPIWDEMRDLALANGGRVWYDNAGKLHFETLGHLVRPQTNSWEDPTVSQYTFTTNRFQECNPRYDPEDVINHVIVEAVPLYVSTLQLVYSAGEVYVVPPADSLTVEARHRWPVRSVVTPVEGTDFVALTAGGTDISGDVTVSPSTKAARSTLTISNRNSSYTAYMYVLQLRGYPLLAEQAVRVEVEDATSIAQHGRRTERIRSSYIRSRAQAEAIARFRLARYKDPPLTLTLAGAPAAPWLEAGDRVTVVESLTGISDDFFIAVIRWEYDGGIEQTLDLVRAGDLYPYTDYFQMGTTKFGGSGTSGSGRLLW